MFYAFPPSSVLGRVVQKIQEDMAQGILLIPNWSTQQCMVSQSNEIIGERTSSSSQKQSAAPTAIQQDNSSSTGEAN